MQAWFFQISSFFKKAPNEGFHVKSVNLILAQIETNKHDAGEIEAHSAQVIHS